MRKFILFVVCMFGFVSVYNADCGYKELKDLNILASYVKYSYEYNEQTGLFDVVLINVPKELYVVLDVTPFSSDNNTIRIPGFREGQEAKLDIYSSKEALCVTQYLRVITVRIPYLNKYFGSEDCNGHETLEVCTNRFLHYELSKNTFNKLLRDDDLRKAQKEKEEKEKQENPKVTVIDIFTDYAKEYWLPVLLVILSSAITFTLCNAIYRKVKHGF